MSEVAKGMYKFTIPDSKRDYGLCGGCGWASFREYGSEQNIICAAFRGQSQPKRRVTSCSAFYDANNELRKEIPPWMKTDALYLTMIKPRKAGEKMKVGLLTLEEFNELDIKDRVVGFK